MTASVPHGSAQRWPQLGKLLLLVLACFAGGKLGLFFPTQNSEITLFWLPSGIAVAALLRWRTSCWPGIFLGVLLIGFSLDLTLPVAVGIAAGSTLAALITAWLLRRWQFDHSFTRQRDLFVLTAAAALGMTLSALAGVISLWFGNLLQAAAVPFAWLNWWLGDTVGVLLAAPLLLSISRVSCNECLRRSAEALFCGLLLGAAGWLLFLVDYDGSILPLAFLPLPIVLWAALRLGITGTSLAVLLLSLFTTIGTALGKGIFGYLPVETGMYLAWLYMFTVVLTGLMVNTMLGERKKVETSLQDSREHYRRLAEDMPFFIATFFPDGTLTYVNETLASSVGMTPAQLTGKNFFEFLSADDREMVSARLASLTPVHALETYEQRYFRPGERDVYHQWTNRAFFDVAGRVISFQAIGEDITEHKQAEEELRNALAAQKEAQQRAQRSESRYKALIQQAAEALFLYDFDGRFVEVNQQACDSLGYTGEELLQMGIADVAPGYDLASRQPLWRKLELGKPYSVTATHRRKDGSTFPVEIRIAALEIDDRKLMMALVSDITERKQAEKYEQFRSHTLELITGDKPLSAIFEAIVQGVEQLNPAMLCSILLLDNEGKHLGKGVAPSLPDFYNAALAGVEIGMGVGSCGTAAFTGERVIVEDIATHPYWTPYKELAASAGLGSCWSQPIRSASGQVLGTFAIYHREAHTPTESDISIIEQSARLANIAIEHKQAEDALRYSEQRFRDVSEAAGEYLWEIDANMVYTYVSHQSVDVKGYASEELLGHTPMEFMPEEDLDPVGEIVNRAIANKAPFRLQHRDITKSGAVLWEEVNGVPFYDDDGRVVGLRGTGLNITERKEHETQLERIAHYDALTGVPNRTLLIDRMNQAIVRTAREQNMMAVCYLDLDGFKPINDTMGHEIGDHVLIEIAQRIQHTIRGWDTVARLGGDEFVILLLGLERGEECNITLHRMLAAIAEPICIAGNSFALSASIGVSIYPLDDEDTDTLLRHADQAMYVAKQSGKNRFHIYDPALDQHSRNQQEILKSIQLGLQYNQFELYYQPKIDLRTQQLVGAEALIRWNHPEMGLLAPARFLTAVENTALDIAIGEWVIATALQQINLWHTAGLDIEVSINISAYHLESAHFVDKLQQQILQHPDLPENRFQIEVLETVALEDIDKVTHIIESCKKIGVSFALDDFGTGFSSLSYLSSLPVNALKIDQSFIRNLTVSKGDHAIVLGIIALSKAFDLKTVAEGIETAEQFYTLLKMDCDTGQGYGIARPMPAARLIDWAQQNNSGKRLFSDTPV